MIADSYRSRWRIEGVFGELTLSLNGEIDTIAYPPAAIIAYSLSLVSFNVLTMVRASVEVMHGKETADSLSTYHMAEKVSATDQGMIITILMASWQKKFGNLKPREMAGELKRIAGEVQIRRYRKSLRGPKQPKGIRTGSFKMSANTSCYRSKNPSLKGMQFRANDRWLRQIVPMNSHPSQIVHCNNNRDREIRKVTLSVRDVAKIATYIIKPNPALAPSAVMKWTETWYEFNTLSVSGLKQPAETKPSNLRKRKTGTL